MVTGGWFTLGFRGVKMKFHGVIMVLQLDEWDNDGVIPG